ncbi:hypothetical protein GCM10025771_18720 [Niveibacterium umoris]|uniref:Uncharacterized protein n=1 Tax=Niveibacterium umoris TaxID=1193620 RepID=A0A840BN55_9RHOO|nr:hypothetical protein [Niveibacterium umoris]MBB4012939.1 hypothetical protein [Niveibacterium umoris]
MRETIYFKTPAGVHEIQARQIRLHPRLRSLLVLVDGKHSAGDLLDTLQAIGVSAAHLTELADLGLIAPAGGSVSPDTIADSEASATAEAETEAGFDAEIAEATEDVVTASGEVPDAAQQLRQLYSYFNEHIRETLGLRGFMLQLQVEKAETLADYVAIRDEFVAAARKAKGEGTAARLEGELDRLLQLPA